MTDTPRDAHAATPMAIQHILNRHLELVGGLSVARKYATPFTLAELKQFKLCMLELTELQQTDTVKFDTSLQELVNSIRSISQQIEIELAAYYNTISTKLMAILNDIEAHTQLESNSIMNLHSELEQCQLVLENSYSTLASPNALSEARDIAEKTAAALQQQDRLLQQRRATYAELIQTALTQLQRGMNINSWHDIHLHDALHDEYRDILHNAAIKANELFNQAIVTFSEAKRFADTKEQIAEVDAGIASCLAYQQQAHAELNCTHAVTIIRQTTDYLDKNIYKMPLEKITELAGRVEEYLDVLSKLAPTTSVYLHNPLFWSSAEKMGKTFSVNLSNYRHDIGQLKNISHNLNTMAAHYENLYMRLQNGFSTQQANQTLNQLETQLAHVTHHFRTLLAESQSSERQHELYQAIGPFQHIAQHISALQTFKATYLLPALTNPKADGISIAPPATLDVAVFAAAAAFPQGGDCHDMP